MWCLTLAAASLLATAAGMRSSYHAWLGYPKGSAMHVNQSDTLDANATCPATECDDPLAGTSTALARVTVVLEKQSDISCLFEGWKKVCGTRSDAVLDVLALFDMTDSDRGAIKRAYASNQQVKNCFSALDIRGSKASRPLNPMAHWVNVLLSDILTPADGYALVLPACGAVHRDDTWLDSWTNVAHSLSAEPPWILSAMHAGCDSRAPHDRSFASWTAPAPWGLYNLGDASFAAFMSTRVLSALSNGAIAASSPYYDRTIRAMVVPQGDATSDSADLRRGLWNYGLAAHMAAYLADAYGVLHRVRTTAEVCDCRGCSSVQACTALLCLSGV